MKYIFLCFILFFLAKIAYLDYKYRYIADRDILLGLIAAVGYHCLIGTLYDSILGFLCGLASATLIHFAAKHYYKTQDAFGTGDITLLTFIGTVVGFYNFPTWCAIQASTSLILLSIGFVFKIITLRSTVPMAPFLNLSTAIFLVCE